RRRSTACLYAFPTRRSSDLHADVIEPAGVIREKLAADIHKHLVRFHNVDDFDLLIVGQLARNAAVSAADDQHPLDVWVDGHRHIDRKSTRLNSSHVSSSYAV